MDAGSDDGVGFGRRIGYAMIGILAGNAAIAGYFLFQFLASFLRLRHSFLTERPWISVLSDDATVIVLVEIFTLPTSLAVGLPAALILAPRTIQRLPWPLIFAIAAGIGGVGLFGILILFPGGHPIAETFWHGGSGWILALMGSMVGFPTYCWLIRRRMGLPLIAEH